MKKGILLICCLWVIIGLNGCQPATAVSVAHLTPISLPPVTTVVVMPTAAAPTAAVPIAAATTATTPATLPPPPTLTAVPTHTPTATPTTAPSPTPITACSQRLPGDDLYTVVTLRYGLSRDYAPTDLVDINDYLPFRVTLGYPTTIRQPVMEPLVRLINDMEMAGLHPFIISGYRSYSAQAIAWNKWNEKNPETAAIVSAPPGHSEHQLGTTLDFGSPELPDIVGDEDIEFHTYFYMTREGQWLLAHAHEYGFTLSYPREAFELTGFYYEPWHYRYVGVEMATMLLEQGLAFTAYQLANFPEPCIP